MMLMLGGNELHWSLAGLEQPTARHLAKNVGPPSGLTASRAHLVIWWRWRYATLQAENTRLADLLVRVLSEAQGYRTALQAALDALADQADTTGRQRRTIVRLREECRRLRGPVTAETP